MPIWLPIILFITTLKGPVLAQNAIVGNGFSSGWGGGSCPTGNGNFSYLSPSAGTSYIVTRNPNGTGDQYFRFGVDWGGTTAQLTNTIGSDVQVSPNTTYSLNTSCTTSGSLYINCPNTSDNYVFKTLNAGSSPTGTWAFFRVQGAVQSVSSVTRSPVGTVYPGQDVVVTATLSADFAAGQAAYLRYTNDGFSTSTVIQMTGTGTTRTATIPGSANLPSTATTFYVFTSGDSGPLANGSNADLYTINLNNNGGGNYSYTPAAGWQIVASGNWSNPATWNAGIVPPTNANMGAITYGAGVTVTLDQDALIGSLNIATGKTFVGSDGSARTLTIAPGGTFTRVGTFTATATGTVVFQGNGTVSAATTWQNLHIGGSLNVSATAQTINGVIRATSPAAALTLNPTYTATSTLSFSVNGSIAPGNFWTATASGAVAAGRPNDVIIEGNTTLNMPAASRGIARDLTIASGSTLNLNATTGDLFLQRNWSNSGTFNPNGRAVGFYGTSISSTITNPLGETFNYLLISKVTGGTVTLNNNVTVNASTGDVLQFLGTTSGAVGSIDLNGNTLTLSGTAGNIYLGNTAAMVRQINSTGNGTVVISGGTKVVTKGGSATTSSLVFGSTVTVALTNGLDCGTGSFTTVNGTLQINSGGFVSANAPIYGATSTLTYNTAAAFNAGTEWTSTASAGAAGLGRPNDVVVQGNTTLNMPNTDRGLARDLSIGSGSTLNLNGTSGDLYLQRNWTNSGTFNPNGRAVGFFGTSIASTITNPSGETFNYLLISKTTTGGLTLNNDVTVNGSSGDVLQFLGPTSGAVGAIDLNGNTLTLSGSGGNIYLGNTAAMARQINATGSGTVVISGGTKTVTKGGSATTTSLTFASNVTVLLSNGLDCGAASFTTINGTLQINAGGFVINNAPIYGTASNLVYSSGTSYTMGSEWTIGADGVAGLGRPNNVIIQNNTTLNGPAAVRALAGNLTIQSGTSLILDNTAGDLILRGNWINNGGTFTPSGRTVSFTGATASTVFKSGGETFFALAVNKTAAVNLQLLSSVIINGSSGLILQLINTVTGGGIDLNGFDLSLTGTGGNINIGLATAVVRNISGTGNFIISNGTKTVTRNALANGTLTLGPTVNVQLNSGLDFAAGLTTLNGTLILNSGGLVVTNPPLYGLTSTLIYNQGGPVTVGNEWNSNVVTAVVTAGRPGNVTIDNNTDLTLPNVARAMFRNFTLNWGSFTMDPGTSVLSVGADWTRASGTTFIPNGRTVSFWAISATFLPTNISVPGGEVFDGLSLAKTIGVSVNLNCDVTVNGTLTTTTGTLVIGSNTLTLNGTGVSLTASNGLSGNSSSNLVIGGTGAFGTLAFVTGGQTLGSMTLNRLSSGLVTLGTNLTIDNNSGLNNSLLTLSNGVITVNAGFALTVANTAVAGSPTSFVHTPTTARLSLAVTGSPAAFTLNFPVGNTTTLYRPISISNVVQSDDNTYAAAATTGAGASISTNYTAPILGVSSVRYYPFNIGNLANLVSMGKVSLVLGADEVQPIDNQEVAQFFGGNWESLGTSGTSTRTSVSDVDISASSTFFALGITKLAVVFLSPTGNDANTGETSNNVPAGTGPKLTLNGAMAAVGDGGSIQTTAAGTFAAAYTYSKNVNLISGVGTMTISGVPTITAKSVFAFTPLQINTAANEITLSGHQFATGMPVTFENYGQAYGFMPTDINTGTDVLTIGTHSIQTGQQVVYQAYEGSAAGGLVHGVTYYAINNGATSIKLAISYADALAGTPVVNISSLGSAQSHAVIASVPEGLSHASTYYVIEKDANTIQLAATALDALTGAPIDLLTAGGGNHVLYFTPTFSGTFSVSATTLNINEPKAHIKAFFPLVSATSLTLNLAAGTYEMQPTIPINRTTLMTINGAGMNTTILDGKGKISTATNYHGFNFGSTAALTTVTIQNLKVTGYYYGINRNSSFALTTANIDNVESSDNFSRGINVEGAGNITTAFNIRNGIFNDNNGVGVISAGILINGPVSKTGINIRNNELTGNRNAAIEIGAGTTPSLFIRGNTISGSPTVSPLKSGVTEYGIAVNAVAPSGSNSNISNNEIQMYGRAGIECRGCVGNGAVSGAGSFRITSNYIAQAGGPFRIDPGYSTSNEIRDIAGIAVGNLQSGTDASLMVVDTNQVENLQQPNAATSAYTAFGIVSSGNGIQLRSNIVTGCEIGIQVQQGAPGNENNSPDNFYSRDNTATTTNFQANRNSIAGNSDFGARNQGVAGPVDFLGNWWGHPTGPTHPANISPVGTGESLPSGTGIAYNGFLAVSPDDVPGNASGQRGIQALSAKNFRLKPVSNATSLASPFILQQGVSVVFNGNYTDTVDVYQSTYSIGATSVNLNRRVYMRGHFGDPANRPTAGGVGNLVPIGSDNAVDNTCIFYVSVRNCGIENFRIDVSVPLFGSNSRIGVLTGLNGTFSGLRLRNNVIQNIGSYQFASWGVYVGSSSGGSFGDTVYLENNRISNRVLGGSNTSTFGRGVRAWNCNLQVYDNTISSLYAIQHGTPRGAIGTNILNNILAGCLEINGPQAGTSYTVKDNSLRSDSVGSFKSHAAIVEIRDNRAGGGVPILIENNQIRNLGAGGGALGPYGIYSTMADNVTVRNNTFIPNPSTPLFVHVHANTKHQASSPLTAFANGIDIRGNTFNGNGVASADKYAIVFGNHNNTGNFSGGVTIGSLTEPNVFKSNINSYIYLCGYSGNSTAVPSPPFFASIPTSTPTSPVDLNIDARFNQFGVTGGDKLPSAMTLSELFEVENKISHKIDFASLGFVTLKPNEVFVTNNSFFTPYTSAKLIQRGINHAADNWTINVQAGIYPETVTVDKSLNFANNGNTVLQNLIMNGAGKTMTLDSDFDVANSGNLTLTDGIIETGAQVLTVLNTGVGAITGYSSASHVKGNLKRAITTGVNYVYPVGNGSDIQELTLNFTTISGLIDVTVSFTNNAPGTNIDAFNESGALYEDLLQSGYWIVEPNVGGDASNYSMRLKPINFTNFPSGGGFAYYGIMKRVGAGNWGIQGVFDDPGTANRVFADGTIRRNNLSGFSNFGVGAGTDVPLQTSNLQFAARRMAADVLLTWDIREGRDLSHFEIQRSADGVQFETIARVAANADLGTDYQFKDPAPFGASSLIYYRLVMHEKDKTKSFSPVRVVKDLQSSKTLDVFPNPADRMLWLSAPKAGKFSLVDALGRIVRNQADVQFTQVDVSTLAPGVYTLIFENDEVVERVSFIKK